jgi:sugar fermentation stimulation protein A
MVMKYIFAKPLVEGLIKSRPNRFIMVVDIKGIQVRCHCPSTGRIGGLEFRNIPCLLSESDGNSRKTRFTVEAFSLDPKSKRSKSWIGINQGRVNAFIEFFMKNGIDRKSVV